MTRPKTATLRPSTSGGRIDPTVGQTASRAPQNEQTPTTDDKEILYSSSDSTYEGDSDDNDRDQQHHQATDEDDDVFAFAPPGLGIPAIQVVPAPSSLPAPPPPAFSNIEHPAEDQRKSILCDDQQNAAVNDGRANLVHVQEPTHEAPDAVEQQTNRPIQRSTSIKWGPSTHEGGGGVGDGSGSGKHRDLPGSPASSTWHDGAACSNQAGTTTPTSDSADLLRMRSQPFSRRVELELEEEEDSPYPEVRASVSNVDDPSMPAITFRSIVFGLTLSAFASAVNTFLSQRNPPMQIAGIIIQILVHPIGMLLAKVLPIRSFRIKLPKLRRDRSGKRRTTSHTWSVNPGPWNIKEHTVVMVATTTGLNPSYSLSLLLAQDLPLFWDDRRPFLYGFLSISATQLIGLALTGFVRQVLVEPASMVWPQNLAVSTVLNTLHADEDSIPRRGQRQMSRLAFFNLVSLVAFVVYLFPGYLAISLSVFNWVCWIWPNNVPVNVVFGTASGLGASVLTFDWTQVTYLSSPLVAPWWAQVNLFAGFVAGIWIAAPILYFTNALHTAYLPILSGASFDRFGQHYNVTLVSPDRHTLLEEAYEGYSQVYISAGLIVTYFGGFAAITTTIVHTALYHGRFVWGRMRSNRGLPDDVHARLMRRYAGVPLLWHAVLLIAGLAMSVCLATAYGTGLPIWALCLAILIPIIYIIPLGFIFATSGYPPGVNLVSELLASWVLPGRPLPVMMFKAIGQQTLSFALLFAQDQKLAHYMKVAPQPIFLVQVLSILVNSVVQMLTKNFMRDHIVDLCDPDQPQYFTCPGVNLFYTASVLWGAIGVERSFGPTSPYRPLFFGLLVGAVVPVVTWFASRKLKWSWTKLIATPIFFGGMSMAPPASGINFTSAIVVGFVFQYWMRRHRVGWWARYNFVLAGALDFGTLLSCMMIYFVLQLPKDGALELEWWGNTVFMDTADANEVPLLQVPDEGFAPAPGAA
ncbi:Oligopeptide transporter, OPT superfamily [Kalmanozyma brasiliensis GHG001]|uniref:Sexual differentiation process protein ISP4 n=1 Tax=Kalmanozyma brasiliensis (strain GHG001) TaxID=1365824 RepID=V5ELG7_KALBG|nr:Oligopeptide transporter, OPT superfamily [Kalmanozyma brasiliensis GHG001]EST05900.1 Oligopeptide transporter, OPT superfamily [Kalmanozyma brasiliensis GHG001]